MPKGSTAGRNHLENASDFLRLKVRKNPCCIPKDICNTYDPYLRIYINHLQVPSLQQKREKLGLTQIYAELPSNWAGLTPTSVGVRVHPYKVIKGVVLSKYLSLQC